MGWGRREEEGREGEKQREEHEGLRREAERKKSQRPPRAMRRRDLSGRNNRGSMWDP